MRISEERLIEIMENDSDGSWTGDNTLQGLNIIAKYFNKDKEILEGADHDVIYSVSVDDIIDAGITEEDVKKLSKLNWMIENDYLACYV